ncbi:PD-(D/E)XK nuclease family transposase N-terminal domain protein (plasmid) [Candidatus Megaera polyxenophila]|nr:PD-(D/E)XK nuclease family transposase N-terminal domain protein [Candidatus Megaera polyxenophila]
MPSLLKGKKSLCDLKVKDNKNNIYIIEMQKRNEEDYLQRIQYYASHAITDQLEQGTDHTELNPVITISIMGRKCFDDNIHCISYHPFKETTTGKHILLTQSHIFIELPKLEKSGLTGSTLEWLEMFKEAAHLDHIPEVKIAS